MNQPKGFSLIEVLLSLTLTTTLALFLLELQGNARLFFKQTENRTEAFSLLVNAEEEQLLDYQSNDTES